MNLHEIAKLVKPVLKHLYGDGEEALKEMFMKTDMKSVDVDIHNISIAPATVNVRWSHKGIDQDVIYLCLDAVQRKCMPQTETLDKEDVRADWLSWSGGEEPSDEHQITVYVDDAASAKYDKNEVREFLTDWAQG